ncbi:hypothetical protein, partial [Lacticaseibacillus paracasei]|uniref:hypothetical protein n=1 Tax=Lacticaseibacillus paracasei TaxID=1597 RepID=UPI0021A5E317
AHAITTDAWRNSLDHYQEFVIIVALDLKIEVIKISVKKSKQFSAIRSCLLFFSSTGLCPMSQLNHF